MYTGQGLDKDPAVFEQWRQEVTDFFDLSNADEEDHLRMIQYFVSGIAKEYYQIRMKQIEDNPISAEDMLEGIKQRVVPSNYVNEYWRQWDEVSQNRNGRIQRVREVACEIDKIAERLGNEIIGDHIKLHRFLGAMHLELRRKVELDIDRSNFVWADVVDRAEKFDEATRNYHTHQKKQFNNKQRHQQRRKDNLCYFCGKKGHMITQCHVRKNKGEQPNRKYSPQSSELEDNGPGTLGEYPESPRITCNQPARMTTQLIVGGKLAKVLLCTGTVGTNLLSLDWAQANGINTTKMTHPSEIKMATKDSRATTNLSAKAEVNIRRGRKVECSFLLVPMSSYDVILGMPFMVEAKIILDPAKAIATFEDDSTVIHCSATEQTTAVTASGATAISADKQSDHNSDHLRRLENNQSGDYNSCRNTPRRAMGRRSQRGSRKTIEHGYRNQKAELPD